MYSGTSSVCLDCQNPVFPEATMVWRNLSKASLLVKIDLSFFYFSASASPDYLRLYVSWFYLDNLFSFNFCSPKFAIRCGLSVRVFYCKSNWHNKSLNVFIHFSHSVFLLFRSSLSLLLFLSLSFLKILCCLHTYT